MSKSSLERVKDRIRKLLNVAANDASTEGEINNAIHMARQMMHAHNLDEADVEQADIEMAQREAVSMSSKWMVWEVDLAMFVSEFIGGVGVYRDSKLRDRRTAAGSISLRGGRVVRGKLFVFYGEAESVALAHDLQLELTDTIATMASLRYGGWSRGPGREYAEGFACGLHQQLAEADRQASSDDTGRALVVRSNALMSAKLSAAMQWLQSQGVELQRATVGSKARNMHHEAYQQGEQDGRSQTLSSERSTKLPAPTQGQLT